MLSLEPSTLDLFPSVGHRGRPVIARVSTTHPSDQMIDAALDAYDDEVFRGFRRPRLTLDQRQRRRSVIAGILSAALGVGPAQPRPG